MAKLSWSVDDDMFERTKDVNTAKDLKQVCLGNRTYINYNCWSQKLEVTQGKSSFSEYCQKMKPSTWQVFGFHHLHFTVRCFFSFVDPHRICHTWFPRIMVFPQRFLILRTIILMWSSLVVTCSPRNQSRPCSESSSLRRLCTWSSRSKVSRNSPSTDHHDDVS